jgi:RecB family endonuclease NucS
MSAPDAQNHLTPAQRYVVYQARATVEAHQAYGTEAVARWLAPPPQTAMVADTADLPGALVFAYDIAMRQIGQLLAIIDTLTGAS